jgi:hypothetical protein
VEEVPFARWEQEVWQAVIRQKKEQLYIIPGYDMDKENEEKANNN